MLLQMSNDGRGVEKLEPLEIILKDFGFAEGAWGSLERKWGDLSMSAGKWFNGWKLFASRNTARTILCEETWLPDPARREVISAAIYEIWREEFPSNPLPKELQPGADALERNKILRSLIPPNPYILVEREFFRSCIMYLDKRMVDGLKVPTNILIG